MSEKNDEQKVNDVQDELSNNGENKTEVNPSEKDEQVVSSVELEERIKELEEKNKELNDRLLRRLAEFENYKKRNEAEKLSLLEYAGEKIILKIIPVYDDLNRSLVHFEDDKNIQAVKDGLQLVIDKFTKIFEEIGIKKIESKGKEFDFNLHEALLQQPSADVPPNTVLEEVEPGYLYKEKVIKHAKVIVSQEVNQ